MAFSGGLLGGPGSSILCWLLEPGVSGPAPHPTPNVAGVVLGWLVGILLGWGFTLYGLLALLVAGWALSTESYLLGFGGFFELRVGCGAGSQVLGSEWLWGGWVVGIDSWWPS